MHVLKYQSETHLFVTCIDGYNSNKMKRYAHWKGIVKVFLFKDDLIVSVEPAQKLIILRSLPNLV